MKVQEAQPFQPIPHPGRARMTRRTARTASSRGPGTVPTESPAAFDLRGWVARSALESNVPEKVACSRVLYAVSRMLNC